MIRGMAKRIPNYNITGLVCGMTDHKLDSLGLATARPRSLLQPRRLGMASSTTLNGKEVFVPGKAST